ncbi:MAG: DUF4276 family protein [Planctomycetaceae bacterium]|jgi:hypothetical protein|nr:DUF4276 family protein [Planctomycetaceae bacterium]
MINVYAVVEGHTERAVIQQVIAPYLASRGILLSPRIVGKPGKKGGDCRFERVLPEICNLITQEKNVFVTTFFDYYALPNDWPNWNEAHQKESYLQKADTIEKGVGNAVNIKFKNLNPKRFIPYIQMHELEALLFADAKIMGHVLETDWELFQEIINEFGGQCEKINDSSETAPSKRIMKLVNGYKKGSSVNAHGWRILQQIGVEKICNQCPHFKDWIDKLEQPAKSNS